MKPQAQLRAHCLRRGTSLPARWLLPCAVAFAVAGPVQADAVIDWNTVASSPVVLPRFGGPQPQARAMAMVQIAVHDALNSIMPRYESYTGVAAPNVGASPDAAVAAATRKTLLELLASLPPAPTPAEAQARADAVTAITNAFNLALGPLPYDAAEIGGIEAGEAAADAILAMREDDGSDNPNRPYNPVPAAGVYVATPSTPDPLNPAVIVPTDQAWGEVTPFALNYGAQFRVEPGEIFDLTSAAYTRDYNQVKALGDARVRGTAPDSEESNIARFWATGRANWSPIVRRIVTGRGLDAWQHARLFALVTIAVADGHLATQDSKWTYKFWRPVTAINWVDDGNPDTVSDPYWRPLLVTPTYPDYPCSLPTAAGAATETMRRFFETDGVTFTHRVDAPVVQLPPPLSPMPAKTIERQFDSLSEAADEAGVSRVYAGLHFYSGCQASVRLGRQVAHFTFQHVLKPLK